MAVLSEKLAGTPARSSGRGSLAGRYILPSVTELIFVALLAALTCTALSSRLLDDGGIGWHIRTGQIILQTHSLPRADPFSVSTAGKIWFAWEWLFDIAAAAVHGWLGLNGIALFSAVIISAAFAMAMRIAVRNGGGLPVTVLLLMLAIIASSIHFFARPHIVSWLMAVIWFSVLDGTETEQSSKRVLWLPLLMLLWVNVHGGFLLGFVLLGIYLVSAAAQRFWTKSQFERDAAVSRLKVLRVATGISVIASFVNPYGYKLYSHVYGYLTDRFLMNHIDEFQSPNFHGFPQRCFGALLLISLAALAGARGRLRLSHLLIAAFAIYSGLYASRNLPVSSLLLVMVIATVLTREIEELRAKETITARVRKFLNRYCSFSQRMSNMELRKRAGLWMIAAFIFLLIVSLQGGRLRGHNLMESHFRAKRFPVQAVDMVERNPIRDPIFAPDYWGGYLIYRRYPHNKVFIDDRHDLYGDQAIKDYMQVVFVQPQWESVLNREGVNLVLAPAESSLANILKISPSWKLTYEDKTAALFSRMASNGR